tara:strand:+ start:383 stop:1501 length:1119 start_codon:yes stop_codon:yes gene_type:complete
MPKNGFSRQIFNKAMIIKIGDQLKTVFSEFEYKSFISRASSFNPNEGLKGRANHITDALIQYLPNDFKISANIINSTFKPIESNHANWNNFIYMPYAIYVERKGCKKEHINLSLNLLKAITIRFTSEFSIRTFLVNFPEATFATLNKWVFDENPHVRRLVSESCRPRLPWAKEINEFKKNPNFCIELLELLKNDDSKYVQRSVANHMNDITKDNPKLALDILAKWKKENNPNTNWIVKHALRNELKKGTLKALEIEGYSSSPQIHISNFCLSSKSIKKGDSLTFSFTIKNNGENKVGLMIDYVCYFMKSNGKKSPKTFKIRKVQLCKNKSITVEKNQSFKPISTRKIYEGEHKIVLFINGKLFDEKSFYLRL